MNNQSPPEKDYRVAVGHAAVTVKGASAADAIRRARLLLCHELPRMWDVIQSLDERRFRVVPLS